MASYRRDLFIDKIFFQSNQITLSPLFHFHAQNGFGTNCEVSFYCVGKVKLDEVQRGQFRLS